LLQGENEKDLNSVLNLRAFRGLSPYKLNSKILIYKKWLTSCLYSFE